MFRAIINSEIIPNTRCGDSRAPSRTMTGNTLISCGICKSAFLIMAILGACCVTQIIYSIIGWVIVDMVDITSRPNAILVKPRQIASFAKFVKYLNSMPSLVYPAGRLSRAAPASSIN